MVVISIVSLLSSPSKPPSSTYASGGQERGTGVKVMVRTVMLMNRRRADHHRHSRSRRHTRQVPCLGMHNNQGTSRRGSVAAALFPALSSTTSSVFPFSFFWQEQSAPAPSMRRVVLSLGAVVTTATQIARSWSTLLLLLLLLGKPAQPKAVEAIV